MAHPQSSQGVESCICATASVTIVEEYCSAALPWCRRFDGTVKRYCPCLLHTPESRCSACVGRTTAPWRVLAHIPTVSQLIHLDHI
jgi:hypothetical protein